MTGFQMGLGMSGIHAAAFYQAATEGLIAAVWQGALLSLAVALGMRLMPKAPASVRFAIWFAVFGLVALLPGMGLLVHHRIAMAADTQSAWLTLDARWCLVVAGAWGMASLMRAASLVLAGFRVRELWKRATPLRGVAGEVASSATGRRAQLCTSDEVDRPTVIGFFAPRILVPGWLVEKLSAGELEQIVLHESGHLRRADDWLNLLQKLALVVFPLNPALAWVERRLCFERELACDEHVLAVTGAPKAYAACLASLAEHRLGRSRLALALGALGRESQLGQRVGRILRRGEKMRPAYARAAFAGAMLALVGAVAGLDRCPQIVGFAAPAQAARIDAVMGAAPASGFRYTATSFHVSEQPGASATRPAAVRAVTLPVSAKGNRGFRRTLLLKSPARVADPQMIQVQYQNLQRQPYPQAVWVVTTAWRSSDGASVVLTTYQSSGSVPAMGQRDTKSPFDDRAVQTDRVTQPQTASPYAAATVPNGWLVLQL